MPVKGQSPKQVIHTEMSKFKTGDLHSGSKSGPVVKNRKQAIAIALSESRQVKAPKIGEGESKPHYDRSSHHKGNPGFPNVTEIATTTLPNRLGSSTFGHNIGQRSGHLRTSGHQSAHRIGKRK